MTAFPFKLVSFLLLFCLGKAQKSNAKVIVSSHFTQSHANGETDELIASLHEGEDVAKAAVLFCDHHKFGHDAAFIVQVAKSLNEQLEIRGLSEKANSFLNLTGWPKTAGAFKKRAAVAASEDRYDDAAADYVRAYMRPGIDPQAAEVVLKLLGEAMKDLIDFNIQMEKEAAEEAAREARAEEERLAMEATVKRKEEEKADWLVWMESEKSMIDSLPNGNEDSEQAPEWRVNGETSSSGGAMVSMTISKSGQEGMKVWAVQRAGEDAPQAASRFCRAYRVADVRALLDVATHLQTLIDRDENNQVQFNKDNWNVEQFENAGLLLESTSEYAEAVVQYTRAVLLLDKATSIDSSNQQIVQQKRSSLSERLGSALKQAVSLDDALKLFLNKEWENTISALQSFNSVKATKVYLMRAKSMTELGRWGDAMVVAGTWLSKVGVNSVGEWTRGTPKMMLASLGAAAALELGDVEKAKKYMQLVLRADPDQQEFKQEYAALKKLMKHIKTSDELLLKGYNHKALESLEFSLGAMRGLLMTSDTFRSTILLRMCKAYSKIKRHEEALQACDSVIDMRRGAPKEDPHALLEAYVTRSEVLANDNDFSESLRDIMQALNIAETQGGRGSKNMELIRDLTQKKQQTQHSEKNWMERRDHNTVLELPANLDQLKQEKKCSWIKKQHNKLARKWHPDKYKGNRERGSRKMREVSEAKKFLVDRHHCK